MSKKPETNGSVHSARKNLSVKLITVGGAANNCIRHLERHGLGGLPLAVVNAVVPAGDTTAEHFQIDPAQMRDLNIADSQKCRVVFGAHEQRLKDWCQGADVVFIITGLGGKTGSGISPVVASVVREAGALVLGYATMPFECEGSRRQLQALEGLSRLRVAADGVICLQNQNILRLIDENTSLLDTFKISNDLLAEGMRGVWQLLTYQGLIEIHFDDLRAMLRDTHTECLFATAEASGPNRALDLVEKLLAHPLFDGGRALADTSSALISLMGGTDLTMGEVNRVMEKVNRHCDGAQVLMGAAVDTVFADRLVITAVITRQERQPATAPVSDTQTEKPQATNLSQHFLNADESPRRAARHVPPPPALAQDQIAELAGKNGSRGRTRKTPNKMMQEQLPLEIVSKGRFDKSEPTIHHGEDLDQPTYIRRGMVLN